MATQPILEATKMSAHMEIDTEATPFRVLIADDQPDVLYALHLLLKPSGFATKTVGGPADVLRLVQAGEADLVLMDLNYTRDTTSGGEGLELISQIRAVDPDLPILAMTAWGSIDVAVEAMRRGAVDFVQKPWEGQQLLEKLHALEQLQRRLRYQQREQQAEQKAAIEMQRKLLDYDIPQVDGCQISGTSRSARYIGGDYCHIEPTGPRRYAISIADVAGKGVPGALVAAALRAAEKPLIVQGISPAQMCSSLNRTMGEIVPEGRFISFFCAVLDLDRKALRYCNGGHNAPLVVSSDGQVRSLKTGGSVLGYFPDWDFEEAEIELRSGDRVVLFTDGIVEAWSEERGEFGAERLADVALQSMALSVEQMQASMLNAVVQHCNGAFHDDATLVVIGIS